MNTGRLSRTIAALFALSMLASTQSAYAADTSTITETVTYEEVIEDDAPDVQLAPANPALRQYGAFRVINPNVAEVRGAITDRSPAHFRAMMAAYPGIRLLSLVECPGSEDDDANLALSRAVRHAGINTHVPSYGSVRSGGVELFLAGVKHSSEPGAQFGVHSWVDEYGREAKDYAANDPVHRSYTGYYEEMGFDPQRARAFYAFTNTAAPSTGVHYMTPAEQARFGLNN